MEQQINEVQKVAIYAMSYMLDKSVRRMIEELFGVDSVRPNEPHMIDSLTYEEAFELIRHFNTLQKYYERWNEGYDK
jgi:hypothetical protein